MLGITADEKIPRKLFCWRTAWREERMMYTGAQSLCVIRHTRRLPSDKPGQVAQVMVL